MTNKYEDLYPVIIGDETFDLNTAERAGVKVTLQWLDENIDQAPGRTMTESEYSAAVDAAKPVRGVALDRLWWQGRAILFHAGVKIVADPEPEFDNETAEALTVAVWGLPLPDEAGEAGRAIARELKKAGKMIVTAPGGDDE